MRREPEHEPAAGTDEVVAEVLLRRPDGQSIADASEPLTAETIGRYAADEATVAEASQRLSALGLAVLQAGATGLTISGPRRLFEEIFDTALVAHPVDRSIGMDGGTYFDATAPLRIPEDLATCIARVDLPRPPELFV